MHELEKDKARHAPIAHMSIKTKNYEDSVYTRSSYASFRKGARKTNNFSLEEFQKRVEERHESLLMEI